METSREYEPLTFTTRAADRRANGGFDYPVMVRERSGEQRTIVIRATSYADAIQAALAR